MIMICNENASVVEVDDIDWYKQYNIDCEIMCIVIVKLMHI